ncbi:HNH endonuclease [Actinoplanes lobatus]|uniref:HNH endonuclease n=1 Tax=Actinoplanes lobatus TaxID=113568 RepID=A0A7W7MF05_9ACTN|nr:hypothetical protein [Actinoplanes lobatus]MBB4747766.1 hypothetical protein [Actinoplanes lobatus]
MNLLAGIFQRCAVQSAGYLTDYVITPGVLASTAGDNWRHWVVLMQRAGYLTPVELDGGGEAWRLVDDPTNLVHIRLKDELEWERQRKRDNGNANLTVAVRLRDGDECRYCGVIVVWGDQKGGRGATYDHRNPGQAAGGPDDLRVCCHSCNARRSNHADADTWCPPRPSPATPYYGTKTAAFLRDHGHKVRRSRTRPGTQPDNDTSTTRRPRTQRDTATTTASDPAPGRTTPAATSHPAEPRDARTAQTSTIERTNSRDSAAGGTTPHQQQHQDQQGLANPANHRSPESGSPGRDGAGRAPMPSPPTTAPGRTKRSRRGRTR